jgi:hypothetical protein
MTNATLIEQVIAKGDLAQLTADERNRYYAEVCKSVGLNPLTQPLAYITLNGKLVLYALRGATDQLRAVHKVSVTEMSSSERDGVYVVQVKVMNGEGRTDMATGAVPLGQLKGEALANALMKAETKAKRRATLSIVGLGMLDETEVETIPGAVPGPPKPGILVMSGKPKDGPVIEAGVDPATGEVGPFKLPPPTAGWIEWAQNLIAQASTATEVAGVNLWQEKNTESLGLMALEAPKAHTRLKMRLAKIALALETKEQTAPEAPQSPASGFPPERAAEDRLLDPAGSSPTADGLIKSLGTVGTPEAMRSWVERADPAMKYMQQEDYDRVYAAYVAKDAALKP